MVRWRAVPPRIKAILLLAWAVIRTVFRRLFSARVDGLARFRDNYAADRLPPVTPSERQELVAFGRCIACGLCDRGESSRIAGSAGRYRGIMPLMLAASRSMPDFHAAQLSFSHVSDQVLEQKEQLCPTRVPMRKIAHFVRDKADELRRSLPPPAASTKKRRKPVPQAESL